MAEVLLLRSDEVIPDPYKLHQLDRMEISFRKVSEMLSSERIRKVAEETRINLDRCLAIAGILPFAVIWTTHTERALVQTLMLYYRKRIDIGWYPNEDEITEQENIELRVLRDQIWDSMVNNMPADKEVARQQNRRQGIDKLNGMFNIEAETVKIPFQQAIEAQLSSIALGLWTAAEIMLSDLWVVAVNFGPKRIAKNVLKPARGRPKRVEIRKLADYRFNIKHSIGDLFRDCGIVSFQKLKTIRSAYGDAFRDSVKPIFNESDENYANLMVLSAIRNVLLHKNGRVDRPFRMTIKKAVGTNLKWLLDLKQGEQVPIHGDLIADLSNSVAAFSKQLLTFVDQKMATNNS